MSSTWVKMLNLLHIRKHSIHVRITDDTFVDCLCLGRAAPSPLGVAGSCAERESAKICSDQERW